MTKPLSTSARSETAVSVPSRAPEPSVDRIDELASRILRGDILLPKFQRDFVWEKHQIIDLLDSIAAAAINDCGALYYKLATATLHEMSIEAVAPIFERINSRGTSLTIVDLMRAANWSETFDLVDAITGINEELTAKNFGGPSKLKVQPLNQTLGHAEDARPQGQNDLSVGLIGTRRR